ncbi:hypothetical protein DCM91_01360 [Chitinophaga costaii]|nr:hypothetical protein DCM91_01360 [Chitinophaga costaii]
MLDVVVFLLADIALHMPAKPLSGSPDLLSRILILLEKKLMRTFGVQYFFKRWNFYFPYQYNWGPGVVRHQELPALARPLPYYR